MIEVIAASVILAALMLVTVQMLAVVAGNQRELSRRRIAQEEAVNVLERLLTLSSDEQIERDVAAARLSADAEAALRNAELRVTISPPAGEPEAIRIEVEIRWRSRRGDLAAPVRLVAWRHRGARAAASLTQRAIRVPPRIHNVAVYAHPQAGASR